MADLLTPNEVEAAALSGETLASVRSAFAAADSLRARGPRTVIVTLGARGAVAVGEGLRTHLAAHRVHVVDTTAAGDAFNGALATALAQAAELAEALRWANAAGGCAVTRLGAEPSLPRRADVAALLAAGL